MALFALLFVVVMQAAPPKGNASAIIFQPAASFDRGRPMTFTASAEERPEWITFFFRSAATAEFTARLMETDPAGNYSTTLSGDDLVADHLEYYLAYKTQGLIRYLPEDVPARFFSASASALPAPAVAPGAAVAVPRTAAFSLALDGSASQRLNAESGTGNDPRFQQNESLRLTFQSGREKLQVLFDARLRYDSQPLGLQKELSFAAGRMQIRLGSHSLQAGKISLPGSELGLQPFERQGLAYGFSGAAWQLNLFSLATQQLPGFEGFIVPREGASLFGASLGFSLLNHTISISATGLSGNDDPALGINTGFATAAKSRKGDLLSLAAGASFWENSLALGSELALSRCDPDTTDGQPAENDSAWRVSGRYSRGIFDLNASLKNIGPDYNSIGQLFLVNDRRSLDAGIGLRFAGLRLSVSYRNEHNNVENDSAVQTAKDTQANAALNWDFAANGSLQLGYTRGEQNLPATILSPIGGGVTKEGYFGTLSWRPGRSASLQISAQRDVFSNAVDPELDGRSLTLNAGGSFQHPDRFTISFQLGATQASYATTQKESRFYYAFVNGEAAIIAKLLSLVLTAAYNRSEPGSGDSQQTAGLDGGLVLKTPPAWKIGLAMVSLRGNWLQNQAENIQTENFRLYIKCDFSLGGK
jgi:hypothetical protein